ncbi:glycosidase [Flavobacterium sp. GSP27]|uniref:Glycosidase n=2 Tax=Flavobacterium TaxID=237 RepID=A0A3S0Q844_9FLAO|nr:MULTISPECIES: glycoside hydrolase family 130 protein [Flavobacterium]RTY73816.1 glycosidase [Flavobacterium sp. LS1R10]RTY90523.1 glycosidase [Flavobacterium sp. GSN2]RTY68940.1 glycosidase [Flavobacterium sp. LB2P53]RTY80758.1 glycosidase [Flavobacterium sp. LS1P28]RTY83863.1 glycosidase [Flavobacterium sp. ZB4P23]
MKLTIMLIFAFILLSCGGNSIYKSQSKSKDWAMLDFVKVDSLNPILEPQLHPVFQSPISNKKVHWEERNVLNPSAIVKDGKVYLIYRAQDKDMTSRLGLAISDDGLHFKKQPTPIFYPDNDTMKQYEWKGGVEDPRIIESENGTYIMTYTSYDGKTARLCLASSKDLKTWTKHGLVLREEKYKDLWSKSGAIVCKLYKDKIIATKIKGKYWMYFGDTDLYIATSEDLIHWEVAENNENKKMITVLHPRMGYFDSRLVEPGPFALLQKQGIVLIYNGSNAENYNDSSLPKFTYAASQALFDKEKPYKLIDRMDSYFLHPDKPYEKTGEVNEVCFVEGLVYFKKQWFLYYGTADSKIAVAVKNR